MQEFKWQWQITVSFVLNLFCLLFTDCEGNIGLYISGLQDRCESVLKLLANTSCVMEDFIHATQTTADRSAQKSTLLPQSKPKLVTLHAAHVLSMDAMMTTGLEIGSHSADCWKQVFRYGHVNTFNTWPIIKEKMKKKYWDIEYFKFVRSENLLMCVS